MLFFIHLFNFVIFKLFVHYWLLIIHNNIWFYIKPFSLHMTVFIKMIQKGNPIELFSFHTWGNPIQLFFICYAAIYKRFQSDQFCVHSNLASYFKGNKIFFYDVICNVIFKAWVENFILFHGLYNDYYWKTIIKQIAVSTYLQNCFEQLLRLCND